MKIGLIGAGRLGLCFALLMERAGYTVIASDIREDYVNGLNEKRIDTNEPDVEGLLSESSKITFTTNNWDIIEQCDLIYTFVATPSTRDGDYDVSAIEKVVQDFTTSSSKLSGKSLVIGCTTNPGDCDRFQDDLSYFGMDVYYNPEFIAQGTIIKDLINADMVLIGGEGHHTSEIEKIYYGIQGPKKEPSIHYMSLKAGEIVKIAINTFLTTKISYANLLGEVLIRSGLSDEVDSVLNAIGTDTRVGKNYLTFGFGFGGPCLPRDNRAFASHTKKVGIEFNIGETTDKFNDAHAKFMVDYFIERNKDNLPFCFKYLTYKKGTDILEESQQYRLCLDLLDKGYEVYCIDDLCKEQCDDRIKFIAAPMKEVYWIDL